MVMVAMASPFHTVIVQKKTKNKIKKPTKRGPYAQVQWDRGGYRVDVGISVHAHGRNET